MDYLHEPVDHANAEHPPISEIVNRKNKQALLRCFYFLVPEREVFYMTPKFN
jgi:hypothetical protein